MTTLSKNQNGIKNNNSNKEDKAMKTTSRETQNGISENGKTNRKGAEMKTAANKNKTGINAKKNSNNSGKVPGKGKAMKTAKSPKKTGISARVQAQALDNEQLKACKEKAKNYKGAWLPAGEAFEKLKAHVFAKHPKGSGRTDAWNSMVQEFDLSRARVDQLIKAYRLHKRMIVLKLAHLDVSETVMRCLHSIRNDDKMLKAKWQKIVAKANAKGKRITTKLVKDCLGLHSKIKAGASIKALSLDGMATDDVRKLAEKVAVKLTPVETIVTILSSLSNELEVGALASALLKRTGSNRLVRKLFTAYNSAFRKTGEVPAVLSMAS